MKNFTILNYLIFTIAFLFSVNSISQTSAGYNTSNNNSLNELKMFPNPSQGNVSISGSEISELKSIEIYDILGSKVKSISVSTTSNKLDLNLSNLKKGVYLVRLNDKNGNSESKKLVLQ